MPNVRIETLIEKFNLKNLTPEVDITLKKITLPDINRPALQLTGFFEHFAAERVQVVGMVEYVFLSKMDPEIKWLMKRSAQASATPPITPVNPCFLNTPAKPRTVNATR